MFGFLFFLTFSGFFWVFLIFSDFLISGFNLYCFDLVLVLVLPFL